MQGLFLLFEERFEKSAVELIDPGVSAVPCSNFNHKTHGSKGPAQTQ